MRGPLLPSPQHSRASIVRLAKSAAAAAAAAARSVENRTLQHEAQQELIVAACSVEEATVLDADPAFDDMLQPEQPLTAILQLSSEQAVFLLVEAGAAVPQVISNLEGQHLSLSDTVHAM